MKDNEPADISYSLDPIDWGQFLQVLSVERTEAFLSSLNLPFDRGEFKRVLRFARACCEVDKWSVVGSRDPEMKNPELQSAWTRYRVAEGVLTDGAIQELYERYRRNELIYQHVSRELSVLIGNSLWLDLVKWFIDNFRTPSMLYDLWPAAIKYLLSDAATAHQGFIAPPFSSEERRKMVSFSTGYYMREAELRSRFQIVSHVAESMGPTLWEVVLDASPEGSSGDSYMCLSYIQWCLEGKLLRREWEKLHEALGSSTTAKLVDWVRKNESVLPDKRPLGDPPADVASEHF